MNELLLDKLKVKPKPELNKKGIIIKLEKPEAAKSEIPVDLKIKIIDKTEKSELDRKSIIHKLKGIVGVEEKIQQQPELKKSLIKSEEITKKEKIEKKEEIKEKIIFINPIKIGKIKLESKDKAGIQFIKKETKTKTKKEEDLVISGEGTMIKFKEIADKIPNPEPKILIQAPSYYMNNREIFINFISTLFNPYKKEIEDMMKNYSCDKKNSNFELLIHQKIVRDYLNLFTPYRGLLLYHGLGSGKTCSSIAIAEGFKSDKQIYVMIPASLRTNYIEELKKCGDLMYRKNQYWEFISVEKNPDLVLALSEALNLTIKFIKDNKGAWFINTKKEANYDKLTAKEQNSVDIQLDKMIESKYRFINYNGINKRNLDILTVNDTVNPFNNCVVIVDEAHNLVSRIVNMISKEKKLEKPRSIATKIYNLLMTADNCRIVLLSGTPIINYPNEIGIMMNMIRGKIKVWKMKLDSKEDMDISKDVIMKILGKESENNKIYDMVEYRPSTNYLTITRNPFGFTRFKDKEGEKYKGVVFNLDEQHSDKEFIEGIVKILKKYKINVTPSSIIIENYNCLPDNLDNFSSFFIEHDPKNKHTPIIKNMNLFKRRILGLTSYFPDIDALLPEYEKEKDFKEIKLEMSDFQFAIYEEARVQERKLEMQSAKKKKQGLYEESVSTYRIFSRGFCNFVFPKPDIVRPMPANSKDLNDAIKETADIDLTIAAESIQDETDLENEELGEIVEEFKSSTVPGQLTYDERKKLAMKQLEDNKEKYLLPEALKKYSPKFLKILENLENDDNVGLHLMYSQFRTLEGIGIFTLILKANGYAQFKIKKVGEWRLDIPIEERGKPCFVLYTGTEKSDEKEIIRNIFNGDWDIIPSSLREELEQISSNNLYGEIIKLIMITASGAEGISLKNVRYVHLTDPYWHPVRLEQVIGRARRICSHKSLPKELQTVEVFMYLMTFSESQLENKDSKWTELINKDKGKLTSRPLTSDEALYEIAGIKENINKEILKNVKEAAIDCNINSGLDKKNSLNCFSFGVVTPDKFSYSPSIEGEESDKLSTINKKEVKMSAIEATIKGVGKVAIVWTGKSKLKDEGNVFDLDSYKKNNPIQIGKIEVIKDEEGKVKKFNFTKSFS